MDNAVGALSRDLLHLREKLKYDTKRQRYQGLHMGNDPHVTSLKYKSYAPDSAEIEIQQKLLPFPPGRQL